MVLSNGSSEQSGVSSMDRSGLRLILSIATIFIFVILVTMAAYFLQSTTAAKRLSSDEHIDRLNLMQELENAIASSMFAPHDYLISGKNNERDVFARQNRKVEVMFSKLRNLPNIEAVDRLAIEKAYAGYRDMLRVELKILSLPNPRQNPTGPGLMEKMHVHQNAILAEFDHFAKLENVELAQEQQKATQAENRWFLIIGIIGALVASLGTLTILRNSRTRI